MIKKNLRSVLGKRKDWKADVKTSVDSKIKGESSFKKDERILKLSLTSDNKEVKVVVRFLPTLDFLEGNSESVFVRTDTHYLNYGSKKTSFPCRKNFGDDCAMCDYIWSNWDRDNKENNSGIKGYLPSRRGLVNVFIKSHSNNSDVEGKVMLVDVPWTIIDLFEKANSEEIDFMDIDDGYDFVFHIKPKKDGDKIWPSFDACRFKDDPSKLAKTDEEMMVILENTINLDEFIDPNMENSKTNEEMEEIIRDMTEGSLTSRIREAKKEEAKKLTKSDVEEMDIDELSDVIFEKGFDIKGWKEMDIEELRKETLISLGLIKKDEPRPKNKPKVKEAPKEDTSEKDDMISAIIKLDANEKSARQLKKMSIDDLEDLYNTLPENKDDTETKSSDYDDITADDFDKMGRDEIIDLIAYFKLDINADDFSDLDDLKDEIESFDKIDTLLYK